MVRNKIGKILAPMELFTREEISNKLRQKGKCFDKAEGGTWVSCKI